MENKNPNDANYDRGITSAETAARMEREGENFKENLEDGQTVDREGLANNYAVEPEMYYEEPGDRQEIKEAEKAERAEELKDVNTPGGKGVGII
ncbi:hypothetical protein I4641_14875 [Waterburya agarophytonicola K14]|uniref:Uncharacterized protein n=1 Tax=Waterburya agarophytonicola KI4 TaxID=2874699 RepID=A0A964BU64_9CYAN|nr:hypothetical protein [Waterburya agarophytonicola]MCC0178262.1 hypothetical protein [Waterburya agarophytonicola KI4]